MASGRPLGWNLARNHPISWQPAECGVVLPTVAGMTFLHAVPTLSLSGPATTTVPWVGAKATTDALHLVDVTLSPDPTALPGGQVLQHLMNGLGGWALILALAGLLVGAATWAVGSHGSNYQQSFTGRRAVLISGLAALLIGAGPAIVNFFFAAGRSVH